MDKFELGYKYEYGIGCEIDLQKAVKYYEEGANEGNHMAQYHLASCYEDGIGVEKNIDKAIELYEKSEKQGNDLAGYCS